MRSCIHVTPQYQKTTKWLIRNPMKNFGMAYRAIYTATRSQTLRILSLFFLGLIFYKYHGSSSHQLEGNEGIKHQSSSLSLELDNDITDKFLEELDHSTQKCINYIDYSQVKHLPLSKGKHKFPFMRPPPKCRTFKSEALEKLIIDLKSKMKDPDLARLMENALPNTLDTTILWHSPSGKSQRPRQGNGLPETFVVTGDIHAEWLRDSARQLSVYQPLAKFDDSLKDLIKGAIRTQEQYIMIAPYCNAFHPPEGSGVKKSESAKDQVFPRPDWNHVFECKYEIDSLASFLTLTNEYLENTNDFSIITSTWIKAYEKVLAVLQRESRASFDSATGYVMPYFYSFQRDTNIGSETLPLSGVGNPVNCNTGLVRSAFRPSDDATILQFFIPGNAHMLSELRRSKQNILSRLDNSRPKTQRYNEITSDLIDGIHRGIEKFGIVEHPKWGKVYAYEVDGYGGYILMDDANIPSLLSLPEMGIVKLDDEVYQNTRKMILSKEGNPYYLVGPYFEGIGGPHIGIRNAWPMSLLMRIRTTEDDDEILKSLHYLMETTAELGLMHESVNVYSQGGKDYTRSWFSWCNSEFGKTILHLALHKPHIIFKEQYSNKPYKPEDLF